MQNTANYSLKKKENTDNMKNYLMVVENQNLDAIDTQMKANETSCQIADAKANNNTSNIGDKATLNTIDKSSLVNAVNELFQSVSNGKDSLETAITGKSGTVSKAGAVATFAELESGINSITGGGLSIDSVKLNVTAGYTKDWTLAAEESPLDLMVTVVEHLPAVQSNPLNMQFDNGDSSDFNPEPDAVFDGAAKCKISYTYNLTDLSGGEVSISDAIDIGEMKYSGGITLTDILADITLEITPSSVLLVPTSFIDLTGITSIESFNVATVGGNVAHGIGVDFGSGPMDWNGSEWTALAQTENGILQGLTVANLNALTSEQIEQGRAGSNQIKFWYVLIPIALNPTFGYNSAQITVNHPSVPAFADTADFTITQAGQTVTLTINKDGDYTIRSV